MFGRCETIKSRDVVFYSWSLERVRTATCGGQRNLDGGPVVPTPRLTNIGVEASG